MLATTFSYAGCSLGDALVDMAVRFVLNVPPQDLETIARLFFQIEEAHWFYEDFVRVDNPALPSMKFRLFVERLFHACPLLKQYSSDPLAAVATFQSYKNLIPVRGGIILDETLSRVLMVKGWKSNSTWGFPKGKINKDESDVDCAVREVLEETGFDMSPYVVPEDFLEINRQGKNIILFVVRGVPHDTVFETRTRKEISKISWHTINSMPGFSRSSKANSTKFYLAMPFMNGLKKYIAKQKGHATSLSSQEEAALKQVLGGAPGEVSNDEDAAQRLLSLLQAPPQNTPMGYPPGYLQQSGGNMVPPPQLLDPSIIMAMPSIPAESSASEGAGMGHPGELTSNNVDRQILLDLIKGGSKSKEQQLESAQEILGLLQNKIATDSVANESVVVEQTSSEVSQRKPGQTAGQAPPVPTGNILESLVSSRKAAAKSKAGGSTLMSLLKGGSVAGPDASGPVYETRPDVGDTSRNPLMEMLRGPSSSSRSEVSTPKSENKLFSLLGDSSQKPRESSTPAPTEPANESSRLASNSLMALLSGTKPEPAPVETPEPDNAAASNSLMSLLQPNAPEKKPEKQPQKDEPEPESLSTRFSANASTNSTAASNSLMSLLKSNETSSPQAQPRPLKDSEPESGPAPATATAPKGNSLMSLLSSGPAQKTKEAPVSSVRSNSLMDLLNGGSRDQTPPAQKQEESRGVMSLPSSSSGPEPAAASTPSSAGSALLGLLRSSTKEPSPTPSRDSHPASGKSARGKSGTKKTETTAASASAKIGSEPPESQSQPEPEISPRRGMISGASVVQRVMQHNQEQPKANFAEVPASVADDIHLLRLMGKKATEPKSHAQSPSKNIYPDDDVLLAHLRKVAESKAL